LFKAYDTDLISEWTLLLSSQIQIIGKKKIVLHLINLERESFFGFLHLEKKKKLNCHYIITYQLILLLLLSKQQFLDGSLEVIL
jgi:hypothetical protein